MTAKEALSAIKTLLTSKFNDESAAKFEAGKLSDGTVIEFTKLEAGSDFTIVAPDGTKTPAPAGEYELEDARIVVVTEPGKIAEVKDKAAESPAEEQQQEQEMTEGAPAANWNKQLKDLQTSLAGQAEMITSLITAMASFKAETKEVMTSMVALVETVASEDSEPPINEPRQTKFGEQKKQKDEYKSKMQSAFKQFNDRLNAGK